jgi:GH24 family phage-related lysozyme (muramidase)
MPGGLFKPKAAGATPPPGGGFKNFAITAAPLFASLAAGYSSGRGPYAYMDQGLAGIQAAQKEKRDAEIAAAASAAFGGIMGGGMVPGGLGVSSKGGTPYTYTPSQPMPKADLGVYGAGSAGIGFAGKEDANTGVLGAQGGLGFQSGGGDPTLGLIKKFEGFRETPYWDVNALRTGYGSDTVTLPDGTVQRVGEGTRVTREDADRDLQRRVNQEFMPVAAKAVGEDVFMSLAPNQKAALTSIAYNYGELPSSVAKAVQSGDPNAVATAIVALGSHNDGVNAGRRQEEAQFYLAGSTGGGEVTASASNGDAMAFPTDPMSDPYVQQLMGVMAMPGLTPQQQAVVQMQLESRINTITAPQPGAEEEAARARRARDAELLGYQPGTPEFNQYVVTGEIPDPSKPGYRQLSQAEVAANPRLDPAKAYQVSPDGKIEVIGGGGTNVDVNMGGDPALGKLSADYTYQTNPDGTIKRDENGLPMAVPVPGSPAAIEAEAAAAKAATATDKGIKTADIVLGKLDELDALVADSSIINPATGFGAETAAGIGGTRAADTKATIDTIAANMAFDALSEMRAASPTGGALGSITENELTLLSSTLSSLTQKQSPEQFKRNVQQLREIYSTIRQKADAYPNAAQFGFGGDASGSAPPGGNVTSGGVQWSIAP